MAALDRVGDGTRHVSGLASMNSSSRSTTGTSLSASHGKLLTFPPWA